ncbi:MAG: hypothetical protein H0X17_12945, partial [Deltaproteobacteria bacterium]|nr:hypothetical protein [Deltaproteobacteria bacterium]
MPLRVSVVVAVLASTLTPATAGPAGFVWQAPASCPDADDVRARIDRRLGTPRALHGIAVAIAQEGDGFVARVDTRGAA